MILKRAAAAIPAFFAMINPAFAAPFDSGDTAWMLVSALLVLMMTLPGLALFYGGLVKKDNVLATLMQALAVCAVVSIAWPVLGYTLAFSDGSSFVGDMSKFMLDGVTPDSAVGTIPESVFIIFQMTFAIITVALLVGAVADRIKFKALLVFTPLWLILVYAPIAHWVWGPGGFLGGIGLEDYHGVMGMGEALDFAGGTVVHINSGVAGLVAALLLGRSLNKEPGPSDSNNLVMSVIGAGLLWVGWFGFNAGSALSAGGSAGYAMLVTNVAAGTAALSWIIVEMMNKHGKASVQGAVSGVIAGLVAITPAAGFIDFQGALLIGLIAGPLCYWAVEYLKDMLRYDDALDVFALHGIGGIIGALLTGVLANPDIGGAAGAAYGNMDQVWAQVISIIVVALYSAAGTALILSVMRLFMNLRVPSTAEFDGLDLALHGETIVEGIAPVKPKPKAKTPKKKSATKATSKTVNKPAPKASSKPATKKAPAKKAKPASKKATAAKKSSGMKKPVAKTAKAIVKKEKPKAIAAKNNATKSKIKRTVKKK